MESFFARLKVESLYAEPPRGFDEAYSTVFEYIELFTTTFIAIRPMATNALKIMKNNITRNALKSVSTFCG